MMNKTAQLLNEGEKLQKLSDEAIRDIYARQTILKIAKKRRGFIREDSDLFKGLDTTEPEHNIYEAIKDLDIQLYSRLNRKDCSIEEAIINEFTKDTSELKDSKEDIMRYKLEQLSECCGVPKAVLVHNNINGWSETEQIN